MENKKKLSDLPMNKLGLGGAFNNYFFNKRGQQQSDVITLAEFFALNQSPRANKETFICWRTKEIKEKFLRFRGFKKESVSFQKLKIFLLKNKFTHEDWVLLLPKIKTSKGLIYDLSLLDKEVLLSLPYHKVTETKLNCHPARRICDCLNRSYDDQFILVKDILCLTNEQVKLLPGYVEKTLINIQRRFKKHGLTDEDGPFMKINFSSVRSKDDYVNELIAIKGFSKKEAVLAVNFGIRAGWISV